jgi:hypothetical protein
MRFAHPKPNTARPGVVSRNAIAVAPSPQSRSMGCPYDIQATTTSPTIFRLCLQHSYQAPNLRTSDPSLAHRLALGAPWPEWSHRGTQPAAARRLPACRQRLILERSFARLHGSGHQHHANCRVRNERCRGFCLATASTTCF